ncbi:MAG: hypothetical protein KAZ98_03020 [Prevotella sp.]|nr:hypothetical protein [Prevotella sp.]
MNTNINEAQQWISQADALLLSASNGLSIAEGYHLFADNDMFRQQFGDYRERFGIRSVIQGASFTYPSEGDRQQFFSRLRQYWTSDYKPSEVMRHLRRMVADKPHFIVTSNGDQHLEKAGYDEQRIFEVEGTFADEFCPDEAYWHRKNTLFQQFLAQYQDARLVVVELGIGSLNRLIKLPLMQFVAQHAHVRYITMNLPHEIYVPEDIQAQSIALAGDLATTLQQLIK